ncbi:sigma-70 family RNA polymerase sigma factor [bacterium]|nr:sigma-70 family RNA polymerase sigma factor [bacterium]
MMGDAGEAEDLCQETLLRAYQNRHRYDPAHRFSTWLFTLATRLCLSEIRRRQIRPLFMQGATPLYSKGRPGAEDPVSRLASPSPSPREAAEARQAERLLVAALAQLPPAYRAPLSLFYEQELSIADIASALGISENLVKVRLFRGRRQLLEILRPQLE